MNIAFRVRFEIDDEAVGRNNGSIDMVVERLIVDELAECAVLGAYIHDESVDIVNGIVHACDSSLQVGGLDVSDDGIEISHSRVDDAGHLVVHQFFEVRRDDGEVAGDAIDVRQSRLDMIAFKLRIDDRYERIDILHRGGNFSYELALQGLHEGRDKGRGKERTVFNW